MARRIPPPDQWNTTELGQIISGFFDAAWYLERYPDVETSGVDPVTHFLHWGAAEGRDPNRWFDSHWYLQRYPDVLPTGMPPLMHYMIAGAAELRNPHPRFDSAWYADQHPEAARNPLLHHLLFGQARGWATEPAIDITAYLPSGQKPLACPAGLRADVIIPVYRGLEQTQRCITSVLADKARPQGRIIVVDDCSPEPALSAWLDRLAGSGRITLLRNRRNLGFVASVNRGIETAGRHDVALLNSDTEVPQGWLRRLAAQAYAAPRIASVSPFSNNATICSYPANAGGPLPLGQDLATLDELCRTINAGRSVEVPTTVGFCMYIRRAALDDAGGFDAAAFGRGYGEENDFCMRTGQRGWSHRLACDTFVYHEGEVSFGDGKDKLSAAATAVIAKRYPTYARDIERHVRRNDVAPYRFALTAALFRKMGLPVILMLSHQLGGGVGRHIEELAARLNGRANVLLLHPSSVGTELSVPLLKTGVLLRLPAPRLDDLVAVLQSAAVSRVHIHHLVGMDLDVRGLIHRLGVPLDVTLHDYFALCPQVNLLPFPAAQYCGEPGPAGCNACIATRPAYAATDILSWRQGLSWVFLDADRVLCPSEDGRARLEQHGWGARAVVAPHEPVPAGSWHLAPPPLKGRKLRVALLGVLANQKGAPAVIELAETADTATIDLHLIGYPEEPLPELAASRITVTGRYDEAELPALLARVKPHVIWLPSQCPETYSYTLSAAFKTGLPIVASRIGAFAERLEGRPLSWLVDPAAPAADWLACFEDVRHVLAKPAAVRTVPRPAVPDFYAEAYLAPPAPASAGSRAAAKPGGRRLYGVRGARPRIIAVAEQQDGRYSPCAYIRLLQPLDHLRAQGGCDLILASAEQALHHRADLIVTQRAAVLDAAAIDALAAHSRAVGARLVYDLDDDLLRVPRDHADAALLRGRAKLVQRLLRAADSVTVSTPALAASLAHLRGDAVVVPNALDERLWVQTLAGGRPGRSVRAGPVRLLYMGTATHAADFALIEPALARLHKAFGGRVTIDLLGVNQQPDLPDWITRPPMPLSAGMSYPGFVGWFTSEPRWDIGLAPLVDTPFNAGKSAIKTLDYAALGLAVIASDVPAYRGSLADGPGGFLVENRPEAWFAALSRLVRDAALRAKLADGAWEGFLATGTLANRPTPKPWQPAAAPMSARTVHRSPASGQRSGQGRHPAPATKALPAGSSASARGR